MHPSTDPISKESYGDLLDKPIPLIRGKKMVALIDIRGIALNMSNEAKQLAANHQELNECRIAEAILTDSLAIRIAANFYFKFFRLPIPMKLFSKEEKAMDWLS
ncbi:MAG: STAS/SEC14 domain-containing protein [Flavobacteriales bacterium]